MKKYYLKDLYVATIYKIFDLEDLGPRTPYVFGEYGKVKAKSCDLKLVYLDKKQENVIDCITGTTYSILEKADFYKLSLGQLITQKSALTPFYDFYPEFAPYIIKKGKDPQKVKVSQKFLLKVKNHLDEECKKMREESQQQNNKNDDEQAL